MPNAVPCFTRTPSPLGDLLLVARDGALSGLYVADHSRCPAVGSDWEGDAALLDDARRQLDEYFEGRRSRFDLPIALAGTPFQVSVWNALLDIPYGETATYGEVARRVGRPGASRAVGTANNRNPVSIVVPCHRVIGAGGDLTGYGWGTDRKAWLLDHERTVSRALAG